MKDNELRDQLLDVTFKPDHPEVNETSIRKIGIGWVVDYLMPVINAYTARKEKDLLYDLDEIDNKPWRVFRQLAKIMPEYEDEYRRYEDFYAHGGGEKVMKLIEAHEREKRLNETKEEE